jgi:hypothetical protein
MKLFNPIHVCQSTPTKLQDRASDNHIYKEGGDFTSEGATKTSAKRKKEREEAIKRGSPLKNITRNTVFEKTQFRECRIDPRNHSNMLIISKIPVQVFECIHRKEIWTHNDWGRVYAIFTIIDGYHHFAGVCKSIDWPK